MALQILQVKRRGNVWKIRSGKHEFPEDYHTHSSANREAERMEEYERRYGAGGYEYTGNPAN